MMSGTEGADGPYLQKPDVGEFRSGVISNAVLSRLLYELCIQFGEIRLESSDGSHPLLELSIFWSDKQVSDWRDSKMQVCSLGE
jgi:hypothetical protein